jgi:hypothetical protein
VRIVARSFEMAAPIRRRSFNAVEVKMLERRALPFARQGPSRFGSIIGLIAESRDLRATVVFFVLKD